MLREELCIKESWRRSEESASKVDMRNVGFLVLIAALWAACSTNNSIIGPNLILISMDTLRADHLGSYGYHRDTSPTIDSFSYESILFEHAYSTSA